MASETRTPVEELIDREEIKAALNGYARGVDRCQWDLVADAYHDDAHDDHGSYKGGRDGLMEWLKRRHPGIDQSMHMLGQSTIDFLSPSVAVAETYCLVFQRYGEAAGETIKLWIGDVELAAGEAMMAEIPCRYVDRFEKRDGRWRIAYRTVVFEEVKATKSKSLLSEAWALARRDGSDALWASLEEARKVAVRAPGTKAA